jgi:CRISPR-associated protein Cmr2
MADYLFLFTIGPVQEFIAAARRTRDLWAGSQLLSELSRAAAMALRDDDKKTLIFPAPDKEDKELRKHDVVNRIMARITTNDPKTVGDAIEVIIRTRLAALCKTTFDSKKKNNVPRIKFSQEPAKNHRNNADKQVADLVEIYWAVVEETGSYQEDRNRLEVALAARKNTRNFFQPGWASSAPKSSIDGLRESVIDEDEYPQGRNDPERDTKIKQLFDNYGAKGAERLSGVDLLKRHYHPLHIHADFPSTSHFAALPLLAQHKNTLQNELNTYINVLKESYRDREGDRLQSMRLDKRFEQLISIYNYDASILFASRLEEDLEGEALKKAHEAFANYRKVALGNKEPEPYYALLHGDGDFMGRVINELATPPNGEEKHRAFSRQLDMFASGVRAIVEEKHLGALVYSGGDDVLALLPLHTVIKCAKELADSFVDKMGHVALINKPTLSIGIAICHHLEPLSDALNLARAAEKIAKKGKKNALAITLSKRGTGDRTISGSWIELPLPDNKGFYHRLTNLTEWHRTGAIPDSAAYDLHDLIERLGDTLPPAALNAEAVRIVKRKRGQQGQATEANEKLVALAQTLPETKEEAKQWNVAKFADELIVTREFAKAQGFIEADQQQGVAA